MIRVRLTAQLKDWTNGAAEVDIDSAKDVQQLLKELGAEFPGIGQRILDDQERVRVHVNVFVNKENMRDLEGEKTSLRDGDEVHILPSVSGG